MEIWLVNKGDRLRLPITPYFEISESANNSTEILNEIGTVNIAGKKGLRTCSLSSFFPANAGYYLESSDVNLNPYYYEQKLRQWQRENEPIRLIITETPYNFEVLIDSFNAGESDGSSDVYYTINLSEYVRLETNEYTPPNDRLPNKSEIPKFVGMATVAVGIATAKRFDTAWSLAKRLTGNGGLSDLLLKANGDKKLIKGKEYKL